MTGHVTGLLPLMPDMMQDSAGAGLNCDIGSAVRRGHGYKMVMRLLVVGRRWVLLIYIKQQIINILLHGASGCEIDI